MVGALLSHKEPQGGARLAQAARKLPMDEASRAARQKTLGYSDESFWRGEAGAPLEYDSAHFSRDKEYATGVAHKRGQEEPREFRLKLDRAYRDYDDLSAGQYGRLIEAALEHDPKLAADLSQQIVPSHVAPNKAVAWALEATKARPDDVVATQGAAALIRHAIQRSSSADDIFMRAGFDAIDSGRDVRKLEGSGIRLKDAAFDPKKAHDRNILASLLLGGLAAPTVLADPMLGQRRG
jgi:hypothetical protein